MNLPNLSQPVQRNGNTKFASAGITPSGIACTLCKMACNQLSGTAKTLCILACDNTVC